MALTFVALFATIMVSYLSPDNHDNCLLYVLFWSACTLVFSTHAYAMLCVCFVVCHLTTGYLKYQFMQINLKLESCVRTGNKYQLMKAIVEHNLLTKLTARLNDFYKYPLFVVYYVSTPTLEFALYYYLSVQSNLVQLGPFSFLQTIGAQLVGARRECIVRKVENADTVCVCNQTYCDDFPALKRPKSGFLTVYESNKAGERFKETELQFGSTIDSTADQTVVVTIDKTQKYQTIFGFGGAFTDTTGQMLKTVNQSLADLLIDSYFSDNGIEYSMARIPIAGTDYSDKPYSYDDVDDDLELKHFALQKEDLEWKIPYIQRALKVSPHKIKLFGSPWSPPSWMKTNHKFNESGVIRGDIGGEYYQTWANYFVKFLDAYKSHDINLWGLTVENEPVGGQYPGHPFNCLNLTGPTERDFVKLNLGPTLAKAGYGKDKLNLMVFDENLPGFQKFVPPILADREAAKYVSGIAYHWYGNQGMGGYPDGFLSEIQHNYTDMFLLNTEACHLEGAVLGQWSAGEKYAFDIIR
ncbi:unnamed protein product [Oppiella nova]|uniref:Glucosylceramidase n=1 Tax=Oppiella nova TaxID=334625 RepID=A0A7R9QTQ5_9ACAR|nr:unnamed protein product [Oppiella nova]CAG2174041.1 unnamed protein product [Oppiella nova]